MFNTSNATSHQSLDVSKIGYKGRNFVAGWCKVPCGNGFYIVPTVNGVANEALMVKYGEGRNKTEWFDSWFIPQGSSGMHQIERIEEMFSKLGYM